MTEDTEYQLACALRTVLPRTPGGKPKRPATWGAAVLLCAPDFDRKRTGYLNTSGTGKGHGKSATTGHSADAKARDYAAQYPDEARAMLLALMIAAADEREIDTASHYAGLLAAFDTERAQPDPFAFGDAPTEAPTSPRKSRKRGAVKTVKPADFARLVAACDVRYPSGVRSRAMLLLLWNSGMRVGELVNSRADALDRDAHEWTVPVEGKSGARVVTLPRGKEWDDLDAALIAWEAIREPSETYYLHTFGTNPRTGKGTERTGRVEVTGVERTLDLLCKRAGVSRVTPHMLRHSWATSALRRGWTLADVAWQLGHKSPNTTAETYVHSDTRRGHELQERDAQY